MGLFNIFKAKDKSGQGPQSAPVTRNTSLSNFDCFYLYGFSDNPCRQSADTAAFGLLYNNVIGPIGGIGTGSAFHPYQLVNPKGITIWQAAYLQLQLQENNENIFSAIANDNALFLADPSAAFTDLHIWPDTRLTTEENPIFSKYVPFVIPFLVYRSGIQPNWDLEIQKGMATKGNAGDYVELITTLSRFLMPQPSFILGFDEFTEDNPSRMIDNFINCRKLLGG